LQIDTNQRHLSLHVLAKNAAQSRKILAYAKISTYMHVLIIVKATLEGVGEMAGKAKEKGLCHCTALRKAARRVSQLYDSALEPYGLRITQRAILNQIARSGMPMIGELAEALVMDRGALAHNLKPLERDGLVEIRVDPKDRRNRLVALTAAGKRKLEETATAWKRAQDGFENAFGVAKSPSLRKALELIVSDKFAVAFQHR
jgi:DNA-binding MarR family transcriptional regulator